MEVWGTLDSKETKDNKIKKKRKKRKLNKRKKAIIGIFSVLLALIVFIASGYFYVRSKIYRATNPVEKTAVTQDTTSEEEETVEYTEVKGITNVLLIGADGTSFDSEDQRSDSILIATLDNNNKKIKLTSLYRDALVYIPGYGENKINASFFLGGPELLMETIKYNYDINLEKYVMINFVGFEAIIDQIGGLEIDVQQYQIHELNKYIGEATGGNDCPVTEPGLQLLNGKQALSYARIRKGVGDDYERTERQREVLVKVAEKLKATNPIKYLGIMNKMLDYVRTNIEPIEALNMAYTIFKFPSLVTEQLSIPAPELCTDANIPGIGSVMIMDAYENGVILNDFIFNDTLPDFILNRSTEKDESIYFEYDSENYYDYDDGYYQEEYYYQEDNYYNENINYPEENTTEEDNTQVEITVPETQSDSEIPVNPENPVVQEDENGLDEEENEDDGTTLP